MIILTHSQINSIIDNVELHAKELYTELINDTFSEYGEEFVSLVNNVFNNIYHLQIKEIEIEFNILFKNKNESSLMVEGILDFMQECFERQKLKEYYEDDMILTMVLCILNYSCRKAIKDKFLEWVDSNYLKGE